MRDGVWVTVGRTSLAAPARVAGEPASAESARALVAVLRPESLTLVDDDEQPAWEGRVAGRRFAGGHTVYQVRLESGATVEVMGNGFGAPEGGAVRVRLSGQPLAVVPT